MDTVNVQVSKEKLLQDLNLVVKETEQLLRDTAAVGGEKVASWRTGVEQNLKSAKARLGDIEQAALERAKATAQATDAYVHEKPWHAIGITAGVGVLVGLAVGMLLNRR
ncbi:MAG TPA: DUF883 family protein [Usitatibacteraceae bacterium]|nr:DUF883 family protein [Usitatibacteraceae bacterium]